MLIVYDFIRSLCIACISTSVFALTRTEAVRVQWPCDEYLNIVPKAPLPIYSVAKNLNLSLDSNE